MRLLIAIGHIVGSQLAAAVVGWVTMLIAAWEVTRNQKHLLEEMSIQLGISVDDLEKEEMAPRIIQFSSERYSSELFRNRLSDLCGAIRTGWFWLSLFVQIGGLVGVVWYTFTDSLDTAVYSWLLVALSLLFWIVSVAFSLVCRLFTGRYPGEAKLARKAIADIVRNRRAAIAFYARLG